MSKVTTYIEPLGRNNYDTWKLQVEALLIKNGTWNYVSGQKIRPKVVAGNAASEEAGKLWLEEDMKARSDLILSMSPSELKQIKNCETSHEVWIKLQSIYQSKGPARKASLLKKLILTKMNEGILDVRAYLSEFFDAVDKLQDMGITINDDLLAIILLYSLPESYENFRCAIESRDDLPKPEVLKVKIFEEFDARKARDLDHSTNAMFIAKNIDNKNEKRKNIPTKKSYGNFNLYFPFKCHRCRKIGHKAADCKFQLKNVQMKNKMEISKACSEAEKLESEEEIAFIQSEQNYHRKWCLDSGCTSHMSAEESNFHQFTATEKPLSLANGDFTTIKGIGVVKLSASNGEGNKNLNLEKVMFVPDLKTNLMSVSKITDKGYIVQFNKFCAKILAPSGNVVAVADRDGDLYFLRRSCETVGVAMGTTKPEYSELKEWHDKLGHINFKSLIHMAKMKKALGLSIGKNEDKLRNLECETCIKAKQTMLPFSTTEPSRTKEVLEIVHSDVCGPFESNRKY